MKSIKKNVVIFLPFVLVFISSLYQISDPDLGWHLKYGEYFFENLEPLRDNTFSTQMADFHWTNISWGIDILSYALYSVGGMFALVLAGAAAATLSFYFFSKAFRLDLWDKIFVFPILLFFLIPINATSFRGQTLSLTFLGLLIYLLSRYEQKGKKILYLIPLLFLIWSNLHGLFVLGLGIFFLWQGFFVISVYLITSEFGETLEHLRLFILISMVSVVATLIHPYGIDIYKDAFLHFQNPLLKNITEYLPPEEFTTQWYNLYFASFIAVIGFLLHLVNKTFVKKLPFLGVFAVLFIMSLWVKRYSWAMYYMIIPLLTPIFELFKPKKMKRIYNFSLIMFTLYIVGALYIKGPFSQYVDMSWEIYCDKFNKCSPEAAEELKKYYIEGKTMTLYNWGGWLIWNYPELKPSTDGRMHLWRNEAGFSAFEYDYKLEQNLTDIDDSEYDVVFTGNFKPIYNRLLELVEQDEWELVYEEETAGIFVRK